MPWTYDSVTKEIVLPVGDTLAFDITLDSSAYSVVLFAIYDDFGNDLACVPADIINGTATIRLSNRDTRDLRPGLFKWNLRLVSSPARDEEGNIYIDETTDEVMTVFGPGWDNAPTIRLTKDGAYV